MLVSVCVEWWFLAFLLVSVAFALPLLVCLLVLCCGALVWCVLSSFVLCSGLCCFVSVWLRLVVLCCVVC